jgi:hypothetical protein
MLSIFPPMIENTLFEDSLRSIRIGRPSSIAAAQEAVRAEMRRQELQAASDKYIAELSRGTKDSKLGDDHPFSLVCANNQAAALQRNGDTAEALWFARLAARYASEVNTLGAPNDELREFACAEGLARAK